MNFRGFDEAVWRKLFYVLTDFGKVCVFYMLHYEKTKQDCEKKRRAEIPHFARIASPNGKETEIMIRTTCQSEFLLSGDVLTVRLKGEIDHHAAAAVRETIDAQICRCRPKTTVLDLSGIDFMDSSGLGLIMGRITLMREIGGEAVLYKPTDKVLRIVRLSGLERMIKIIDEDRREGN